ncbi:MAG: DUF2752 domain-containing protein [Acidimicrobiales bacterium]
MAFSPTPTPTDETSRWAWSGPPPAAPDEPRRPRRLTPPELSMIKGRRLVPVGLGLTAAAACAYTLVNDPNQSSAYPQCPFKALTGLDCPGCGLTRGVFSLLHGRVLEALNHNLLLLVILPVFAYIYAMYVARALGWELPPLRLPKWFGFGLAGFVLVYWVVRNLPGPLHVLDSLA